MFHLPVGAIVFIIVILAICNLILGLMNVFSRNFEREFVENLTSINGFIMGINLFLYILALGFIAYN